MTRTALVALFAVACGGGDSDDKATDRTATDGTDRTGTTTAGDADADADADTDDGLDCDADYLSAMPALGSSPLGECITQVIACGDVVYGTTEGGSAIYDYTFWKNQQSLGSFGESDLDGPERVFVFEGLDTETVTVRVRSCAESWGSWLLYGDIRNDYCDPTDTFDSGGHFEKGTNLDQTTVRFNAAAGTYDMAIIVDSFASQTGNFELTVSCTDTGTTGS